MQATITGTSDFAATIGAAVSCSATIAGTSTCTATLTTGAQAAAVIAGTSTCVGTLKGRQTRAVWIPPSASLSRQALGGVYGSTRQTGRPRRQ
jgi:molybdopterin-binding protein